MRKTANCVSRAPRRPLALALEIDSASKRGRMGVTRDVSATGLLLNTPTQLEPGAQVSLRVHLPEGPSVRLQADIARVQRCDRSSPEPWRYHVALRFHDATAARALMQQS